MALHYFLDNTQDALKVIPNLLICQKNWQSGVGKGAYHAGTLECSILFPVPASISILPIQIRENEQSSFIKLAQHPTNFFLQRIQGE